MLVLLIVVVVLVMLCASVLNRIAGGVDGLTRGLKALTVWLNKRAEQQRKP